MGLANQCGKVEWYIHVYQANGRMKTGARSGEVTIYPSSLCDREDCATPESRRFEVNSSGDMKADIVNIDGTEPNLQKA